MLLQSGCGDVPPVPKEVSTGNNEVARQNAQLLQSSESVEKPFVAVALLNELPPSQKISCARLPQMADSICIYG
jgi:hypothetical protein